MSNTARSGPTSFETADGLTLEGAWSLPEDAPTSVLVFCHPHPQQDGTMNAPLMRAITGRLTDRGAAVFRFNFRGVGSSEGAWGGGDAEVDDVAGAVAYAAAHFEELPHVLAGWSFGAVTSLRWQSASRSTMPWAGIAPPVQLSTGGTLPTPEALAPASRLFVIGDRDQFTTPDELSAYAVSVGAEIEVFPGSDHFFYFREQRVADALGEHFGLPSVPTAT